MGNSLHTHTHTEIRRIARARARNHNGHICARRADLNNVDRNGPCKSRWLGYCTNVKSASASPPPPPLRMLAAVALALAASAVWFPHCAAPLGVAAILADAG